MEDPCARLPWPENWFTTNDTSDAHRCQQMWIEVLRMALADILDRRIRAMSGQSFASQHSGGQAAAEHWLDSGDCGTVCALAGFEVSAVVPKVRAALFDLAAACRMRNALRSATSGLTRSEAYEMRTRRNAEASAHLRTARQRRTPSDPALHADQDLPS